MARYLLVSEGFIRNAIMLDDGNFTHTYIENDRGDRLPTFINEQGDMVISTTKYLVPEGYELVQSDIGNINEAWPLEESPIIGE